MNVYYCLSDERHDEFGWPYAHGAMVAAETREKARTLFIHWVRETQGERHFDRRDRVSINLCVQLVEECAPPIEAGVIDPYHPLSFGYWAGYHNAQRGVKYGGAK